MFATFNAETADDLWGQITEAFRKGAGRIEASRCGSNREILHVAMSVSAPRQRWMSSRVPSMNPAFAVAEVIWILAGRNDSATLNYFNSQYAKHAGHGRTYHGAYGYRLRRHLGLDQLERAYLALRSNPDSRQVVLQIWDAPADLPETSGEPSDADIPCNIVSILKVRSGLLEWMQIIRSNDALLGLPHNIIQFTSLQEIMAGWLEVDVSSYHQVSDSLHLYERDAEVLLHPLTDASSRNSDDLRLPKEESEQVFRELSMQMDQVASDKVNADSLLRMAEESTLPTAYKNVLCLLCAEGARRRAGIEKGKAIMQWCDNPAFSRLFDGWCARFAAAKQSQ